MKTNDSGKKCDCGHAKHDHVMIQKSMTKLVILEKGFFVPMQMGHGACKKCTCPEYHPPRMFRAKRDIVYRAKPADLLDDAENRCKRCGTLFERHSEIDHPFQDK